jgi:hypothetical protein
MLVNKARLHIMREHNITHLYESGTLLTRYQPNLPNPTLSLTMVSLLQLPPRLSPSSPPALSGPLLAFQTIILASNSRLKPDAPPDEWDADPSHVYWNAHVDKANIATYDYSALLYLNTAGI